MTAGPTLTICVPVFNHPRLHGQSKYGVWNRLLGYKIAQQAEGKALAFNRAREPA
jgi:hypothetical protein